MVVAALTLAGCGNETELIPFGSPSTDGGSPDDPAPVPPDAVTQTNPDGEDPADDPTGDRDPGTPETGRDGRGDDGDDDGGCTLTQGYWKNHEESWPVDALTLGGQAYGADELDALLGTSVGGDASLILAHQLIAAMLNVASGAGTPPEVDAALDAAHQWLAANADADGRLPYGTASGSDAHSQASSIADTLADFNEGQIGPGHCR